MSRVKVILVIACLFYMGSIIAQPRVDGGTSAKVVQSSPVISNFVGWAYDAINEKWSGYYNCICGIYRNNNKVPQKMSPNDMAHWRNIISLQFKKVSFEGDDYYLLLVPIYVGRYQYPAIEEDWYSWKVTDIYVFTKDEYNKLKNLNENLSVVVSIKRIRFGDGIYETLSAAMNYLFKSKDDLHSGGISNFYLKMENQNTIRFFDLLQYNKRFQYPSKETPDINSGYYEISASIFKQILI